MRCMLYVALRAEVATLFVNVFNVKLNAEKDNIISRISSLLFQLIQLIFGKWTGPTSLQTCLISGLRVNKYHTPRHEIL
jgi:hypothetical protein